MGSETDRVVVCCVCRTPIDLNVWDGFELVVHEHHQYGPICNWCALDEPSIGGNLNR